MMPLRESPDLAALVRAVVDGSPDGLLVVDDSGRIRLANTKMASITGYTLEQLIALNVDVLIPEDQRDGHRDLRQGFHRSGGSRPMARGLTLNLRRDDGSTLPVEVALSTVNLDDERLVVAAVRDVSERDRAEQRLRAAHELLTVADERERIARDLHDTVLQRLFGLGLDLQAVAMRADAAASTERIESAVDEIDLIIREIRTAVFTLGAAQREGSFGQELGSVVAQSSRLLGFTPRLRVDGPVEAVITSATRTELLATLREGLGNVARHARANDVEIEIVVDDHVRLRVADNGVGIGDAEATPGNGLRNMRERARSLGGDCVVEQRSTGGTELRWHAPLGADE